MRTISSETGKDNSDVIERYSHVMAELSPSAKNETPNRAPDVANWNGNTSFEKVGDPGEVITAEAKALCKAIKSYIFLFHEQHSMLKEKIGTLRSIADNLDKVSKRTKIAGITGGATTAAGGVAAAAGVILSPVTAGASLALTAVGVGVAAAGGVTGASAAIAHGVSTSGDKKKIDKLLQEYKDLMKEITERLKVVCECMEKLKLHDLAVLCEARKISEKISRMIDLATTGGASANTLESNTKAFGQIEGFALAMDFFYSQEKDGLKLKKGLESKLAQKIRKLSEDLDKGLEELRQIKTLFMKYCKVV
ncbi:apolipoprotein L3 isoform X2 [Echeneis naucrates]|nr:apolipoprotein L4 isoform X2 [Echeneis naucrates]XP_029366027.1 apolipoprotein L4 isoform X2 [Echeneis naucrates]